MVAQYLYQKNGSNCNMNSTYRVAVVCICLNQQYWQYLPRMIASARKFFLKGHEVDFICWTDMPEEVKIDAKKIPTEAHPWPIPTLHRYHLFLQEEENLADYDYVYYCDADMVFVSRVGEEIFGDLVGAQHPMYAIKQNYVPPYEPNKNSTAYIPRLGRIIEHNGQKRLEPLYLAGGFQGGRSEYFIKAMKTMKEMIDDDFTKNNYIAVWNDESYWNRYCFDNPPDVVLSPSYVYPDTLNKAYYQKAWGRNFCPKIVTITKSFSLTKEGGLNLTQTLSQ